MDVTQRLSKKGVDLDKVAAHVLQHPETIPELVEGLQAPKGTLRFGIDRVLRLVSEQRPELLYPYFDVYVELLDSDNSFLKWGAILTLANLTAVDTDGRFEKVFRKYYAPITGPAMVTAANVIGGSVRIVRSKPKLTRRITREILTVEGARFVKKGARSPECRNVALGQAVDAFDEMFDRIDDQATVVAFVKKRLRNRRKAVVKKAEKFLKKHAS